MDWAGHNNDGIWMLTDFLAFDEAEGRLRFRCEKGKTLVVAFPDHNTGGMKIGHYCTHGLYRDHHRRSRRSLLGHAGHLRRTAAMLEYGNDEADLRTKVVEYWNLTITQEDADEITHSNPRSAWLTPSPVFSATTIRWSAGPPTATTVKRFPSGPTAQKMSRSALSITRTWPLWLPMPWTSI